jgi:hypothetical protein
VRLSVADLEFAGDVEVETRLRRAELKANRFHADGSRLELKKELPGWVARLADPGEASAEGRVQWRNDTLLLDPFTAANERFDLAARLRLHEKKPAGDFYARWGALSIGMELVDGDKHLHLVGARHWFDNRPSLSSR